MSNLAAIASVSRTSVPVSRLPLAMCLIILAGCATSETGPANVSAAPASPPSAADVSKADGTSAPAAAEIRQLEITAFAEETVCRREAPLGSRITVERCYPVSDGAHDAADAAFDQLARQELESMRQRQMFEQQARQAREAAMRQAIRQQR